MAKIIRKPGKGKTNVFGGPVFPLGKGIGTQSSKSVPNGKTSKSKTGKTTYAPTSAANQKRGKLPRKTKRNSYKVSF